MKDKNKKVTASVIEKAWTGRAFKHFGNAITESEKHRAFVSAQKDTRHGNKLKSFGGKVVVDKNTGKNKFVKEQRGEIKNTKLKQVQYFDPERMDKEGNTLSFGEQMNIKAWNDRYYGVEIFDLLDRYATEYNISEGWYDDIRDGKRKSIDDLATEFNFSL